MPIGSLSGSPGSIYPAIAVLEKNKLIQGKQFGGTVKPRKRFQITSKGKRTLDRWLSEPISARDAIKEPEIVFIKFNEIILFVIFGVVDLLLFWFFGGAHFA